MAQISSSLDSHLKSYGFSVTKTRKQIFDSLQGHEPLTMTQIISANSMVDRASVYRAIELFEKIGIIQRLHIGWKYKIELTDMFNDHHHHISCIKCGRLDVLDESDHLEKLVSQIAIHKKYRPVSHQMEISGICLDCQNK